MTKLLVYNCEGELIHAAINFPGSWHDSKVPYQSGLSFTNPSNDFKRPGYAFLGDYTCFTKHTNGKVFRARKTNETVDIPSETVLAALYMI